MKTNPDAFKDLPRLEIVPLKDVVLHEDHDERRAERIVARLKDEEMLRNPPVVAAVDGGKKYMVLDGANRTTALRLLGCRDALVQIVDYASPDVVLDTWDHLIAEMPGDPFLDQIRGIGGDLRLTEMTVDKIDDLLAKREILCAITTVHDGRTWAVRQGADLRSQVIYLNRIVAVYRGKVEIYRVDAEHIRNLAHDERRPTALIAFPSYTKEEIISLTLADVKLPAGITRHLIGGRALRINLGLELLRSDMSLKNKNIQLRDIIRQKVLDKKVRFYREPTFLFDE
ncbi:MAG: hypothetical protein EXS64_05295 [Candidatus Latescibacteria bacterium]|nr:hypothetical protein [Candidatus Latescibacterota bacterium]